MPVDLSARRTWATRTIAASPSQIFAVLSDASLHSVIDGSNMVVGARNHHEQRLALGTKFGMSMRLGVPYRITNTVIEFDADRRIAWQHFHHHVWRYELTDNGDGTTTVTETFDWAPSQFPWAIEFVKYPQRHLGNIERTLARLDAFVTNRTSAL